jgi:hypothetical protein
MTFLDRVDARLGAASRWPWVYSTIESIGGGALYDATRTIASVAYDTPGLFVPGIVRYLPDHEADANGELIAHAPEDLEALVAFAREVKAIIGNDVRPWQAGHVFQIERALIALEERP